MSTANIDSIVIGLLVVLVWFEPLARIRQWRERQRPIDDVLRFAETRSALAEVTTPGRPR